MRSCGIDWQRTQQHNRQLRRGVRYQPLIRVAAAALLLYISVHCYFHIHPGSINVGCSGCWGCSGSSSCMGIRRNSILQNKIESHGLYTTFTCCKSAYKLARKLLHGHKDSSSMLRSSGDSISINRSAGLRQAIKVVTFGNKVQGQSSSYAAHAYSGSSKLDSSIIKRSSKGSLRSLRQIRQQQQQQQQQHARNGSYSSSSSSISSSNAVTGIQQSSQSWQRDGDHQGDYAAYNNARVVKPPPPDTRNIVHAFTPEAAEAVAYSDPSGIHRLVTPQRQRSYATVDPDPSLNPTGAPSAVKPFARSNQDVPGRYRKRDSGNSAGLPYQYNYGKKQRKKGDVDATSDPRYSSSGSVQQPILVMGELAYAQTYTGATAVASSDSVALSKGGKPGTPDGTTIASSNAVTWVPGLIQANTPQHSSVGVSTAQRVGSLAASGVADGQITLAQADTAVAMAQTEAVEWDESAEEAWHDPVIEFTGDWAAGEELDIWDRLGLSD